MSIQFLIPITFQSLNNPKQQFVRNITLKSQLLMSRGASKRINSQLIQENYINSYMNSNSIDNLGMKSMPKSQPFYPSINQVSSLLEASQKQIRLNVINKHNESQRISIITKVNTSISQLKRKIQSEFYELNSKSLLIKVLEDSRGFIFSNNSLIGDHVQNGDTIYIVVHDSKEGANMNLPSNLTDIFMTLRFVCKSVIKKLSEVRKNLSLRQVLSELISFGFWYANSDVITDFLKLINQMLTKQEILLLQKGAGEILDNLIIKFINFWLFQMPSSEEIYPDVFQQVLIFIEKLSQSLYYANILKNSKITKRISETVKKMQLHQNQKICQTIIKNVNGKNRYLSAPNNIKFEYNPTAFQDSNVESCSLEQAIQMLYDNEEEMNQARALEIFADGRNRLCLEATVRFDFYWKLINGILAMKSVREKRNLKNFAITIEQISKNTSETRAAQLLDKNLLKRLHDFLLESPVEVHKFLHKYIERIVNLAAKNGELSVKKACELFNSPYEDFLIILCQALQKNNEFHAQKTKSFALIYINNIKDLIRMALKSDNTLVSRPLLKVLSNLSLQEQCRYQILNLKGVEIFVKLLETNKQNNEIQRVCAKGLMNLSIASRQIKVKVLAQMTQVIEMYYKRQLDSIAAGYIETILKTAKI